MNDVDASVCSSELSVPERYLKDLISLVSVCVVCVCACSVCVFTHYPCSQIIYQHSKSNNEPIMANPGEISVQSKEVDN